MDSHTRVIESVCARASLVAASRVLHLAAGGDFSLVGPEISQLVRLSPKNRGHYRQRYRRPMHHLGGFGLLSRSIHSAEKTAQVPCQGDKYRGQRLDRQAISGERLPLLAPGSHVDEAYRPDQKARHARHYQMHQKDAFQLLTIEFPLPSNESAN